MTLASDHERNKRNAISRKLVNKNCEIWDDVNTYTHLAHNILAVYFVVKQLSTAEKYDLVEHGNGLPNEIARSVVSCLWLML